MNINFLKYNTQIYLNLPYYIKLANYKFKEKKRKMVCKEGIE